MLTVAGEKKRRGTGPAVRYACDRVRGVIAAAPAAPLPPPPSAPAATARTPSV
jgi:hypothetical protein